MFSVFTLAVTFTARGVGYCTLLSWADELVCRYSSRPDCGTPKGGFLFEVFFLSAVGTFTLWRPGSSYREATLICFLACCVNCRRCGSFVLRECEIGKNCLVGRGGLVAILVIVLLEGNAAAAAFGLLLVA